MVKSGLVTHEVKVWVRQIGLEKLEEILIEKNISTKSIGNPYMQRIVFLSESCDKFTQVQKCTLLLRDLLKNSSDIENDLVEKISIIENKTRDNQLCFIDDKHGNVFFVRQDENILTLKIMYPVTNKETELYQLKNPQHLHNLIYNYVLGLEMKKIFNVDGLVKIGETITK